jgi:hypothetical protein
VIPASAYGEALVSFARADRTADARKAMAAMGITVLAMSREIAERGAEIRAQHERLPYPTQLSSQPPGSMAGSSAPATTA